MTIVICWIDDDKTHRLDAENLEEKMEQSGKKAKVLFYHPSDFKDIPESEKKIDLFLVDYYLDRAPGLTGQKYAGRGISFIGSLREKYPDIPIYAFTALPKLKTTVNLTYVLEKEAETRIDLIKIQDIGHDFLYWDAIDYRIIRKTINKGAAKLVDLLKAPSIEKGKITSLLPEILKISQFMGVKSADVAGRSLDYAQWVRNVLLFKPGFLYNKLYAATAIGLKEEAFKKRITEFDTARYDGIFSRSLQENLWWKTELFEIVSKKAMERVEREKPAPNSISSDIRRVATYAFELAEDEIATCAVCKNKFPDTIGVDAENNEKMPVHYRCSDESPQAMKTLFFDELRVIKENGDSR